MREIWNKSLVLDGGMGTELTECGAPGVTTNSLWASIASRDSPEIVIRAHANFIKAGADLIITNTYKSSPPFIMQQLNCTEYEAEMFLSNAVLQAETARKNSAKEVIIAGGIAPYQGGPTSAYNPSFLNTMSVEAMRDWQEPRFRYFYESKSVDILAIETITGIKEAAGLLELLKKYPKDAYIAFACTDNKTNGGDSFHDVAKFISQNAPPALKGIGINCSNPDQVANFGIAMKLELPNLTLIAYPNTGEKWTRPRADYHWGIDNPGSWVGQVHDIVPYVKGWSNLGFKWIGGCCRVRPEQIKAIYDAFHETAQEKSQEIF